MSANKDMPDDARLFREAIGRVRPLKESTIAAPTVVRPAPVPMQALLDEARVRDELLTHPFDAALLEGGDEISYLKDGQQKRLLQRLRRGQFSVRAEIDLHEMTSAVAREAIRPVYRREPAATANCAYASCTARACAPKRKAPC